MVKTVTTLLTLLANIFLSARLAGEDKFLWEHELEFLKGNIFSKFDGFDLFDGYYQAFPLTILLSLIGQIVLLISAFIKNQKNTIIQIGLIFLWLGLLNIIIRSSGDLLFFLLLQSLLFIPVSIILFWLTRRKTKILLDIK